MTKRILVVPDIHGRTFWKDPVEKYIDRVDRIVFLGDYLDPYHGDTGLAPVIVENLREIIALKLNNREKVILLKGNHDEHYSSDLFYELASGSRLDKQNWTTYHQLFNDFKDVLQIAHLEETQHLPYLFTHAGLTVYWLNKLNEKFWHLDESRISLTDPDIIDRINTLDTNELGQGMLAVVGKCRSLFLGEKTGSVLWADIEEHPMPDAPNIYGLNQVFQVFGHTRIDKDDMDMVLFENLAMIDTQQCFMIDDSMKERIVTVRDYERI